MYHTISLHNISSYISKMFSNIWNAEITFLGLLFSAVCFVGCFIAFYEVVLVLHQIYWDMTKKDYPVEQEKNIVISRLIMISFILIPLFFWLTYKMLYVDGTGVHL